MNIKQFVEDSERELVNEYETGILSKYPDYDSQIKFFKSFTSSKLRELIGEVRREIEDRVKEHNPDSEVHDFRNQVVNEVLKLLDEAGGGK